MAYSAQTYKQIVDLKQGPIVASATAPAAPSGYVQLIPTLWALSSYEIIYDVYEDYTAAVKADFDKGANTITAKLYLKYANTGDSPTELATGAVTQLGSTGNYYIVTFNVAPTAILAKYAGLNTCLLYVVITYTVTGTVTHRQTWGQFLSITDADGDETADPTAAELAYTPADATDWPEATDPALVSTALDYLAAERADGRLVKGSDGNWYRVSVAIDGSTPVLKIAAV